MTQHVTSKRPRYLRPALLSLALLGMASAPALADAYANDYYMTDAYTMRVRPGYGFNGAYEQMTREMARPAYTYTYTRDGYVYTAPVTTYYPVTTYRTYRVPAYPQVAYGPALSRDEIEDRLDDQGYDDIEVGSYSNGYYDVTAEDEVSDRKVFLRVDASTGYVAQIQYRSD